MAMKAVLANEATPELVNREVLAHLDAAGVSADLMKQLRAELAELLSEGSQFSSGSRLAKAWAYATEGSLEVEVARLSGEMETFDVYQWTTVKDLKGLIEARMQIPAGEQALLDRGLELRGDRDCLASYRLNLERNVLQVLQVEARAAPEPESLEVFVTRADGIPAGSLMLIRAGNVRRQSKLRFDEPYKFPVRKDAANPFKVDVYAPFGKARLTLIPSEDAYCVKLDNDLGLAVASLEIEAVDHGPDRGARYKKAAVPRAEANAERTQQQVLASRYFDEHGLYQFIHGIIQTLLSVKPPDPYQYMIEQLQAVVRGRLEAVPSDGDAG